MTMEVVSQTNGKRQRIEMFDVAKGICIIQVVAYHCMIPVLGSGYFVSISLATFLFISGYFFKATSDLLVKLIDRLIVPYAATFIAFNLISVVLGGSFSLPRSIWFLYVLFVSMVVYYFIKRLSNNKKYIQTAICLSLYILSVLMGDDYNMGEWKIGTIFNSILFIHAGNMASCINRRTPPPIKKITLVAFCVFFILLTLMLFPEIPMLYSMCYNKIQSNPLLIVLDLSLGVLFMLSLGCLFSRSKLLAFFGRYSLIVLCYHIFVLRLCNGYLGFVIVLVSSPVVIWLIRKYFPFLFGLKPFVSDFWRKMR